MHSLEARIRKQQSTLICSGLGTILFGAWSVVRFILMRYLHSNYIAEIIGDLEELSIKEYEQLVFVIVIVLLLLDLGVKAYIALSAIKEGRGTMKKHFTYIVIATAYIAFTIYEDVSGIISFIQGEPTANGLLESIVDLTICIAMIEIVVAAIRLRILNQKQKQAEG